MIAPRALPGLDRIAIAISGLCVIHCFATAILVAMVSAAGHALGAPIVHEVGLAIAIGLAIVALGRGAIAHGRLLPATFGLGGIVLMAAAVLGPHGPTELALTLSGVALLATGHLLNRRATLR